MTSLMDSEKRDLTYLRLELKDRTTGMAIREKTVMVGNQTYFTNEAGLIGCFIPRTTVDKSEKVMVKATSLSAYEGSFVEITPVESNIRKNIYLDIYLQNMIIKSGSDPAKGICLNPEPDFDPLRNSYTLNVNNDVREIIVIPETVTNDATAALTVNGLKVKTGAASPPIPLHVGRNIITVSLRSAVTKQDWAVEPRYLEKNYLLTINRANMDNMPELVLSGGQQPIDEGDYYRAEGNLAEPILAGKAYGNESDLSTYIKNNWPGDWRATVDYGDGTGLQALALKGDYTFDLEHHYRVGGEYLIKVAFYYEDKGLITGNLPVKVRYVPPRLVIPDREFELETTEGELLVINGFIEDPGENKWTCTVDYHNTLGPLPVKLNGDKTFTLSHRFYKQQSLQYLTLKVQDSTGQEDQRRFLVKVNNAAPNEATGFET